MKTFAQLIAIAAIALLPSVAAAQFPPQPQLRPQYGDVDQPYRAKIDIDSASMTYSDSAANNRFKIGVKQGGAGNAVSAPISGTGTAGSPLTIAGGAITNSKLTNSSVTLSWGSGILGCGSLSLGASLSISVDTTVIAEMAVANTWTAKQTINTLLLPVQTATSITLGKTGPWSKYGRPQWRNAGGTDTALVASYNANYGPGAQVTVGGNATEFKVGDLNADGFVDLVVYRGDSTSFYVRLGNGDGTFATVSGATSVSGAVGVLAMALQDVTSDGILDLVFLTTAAGAGSSQVFVGAGNGTFGAVVTSSSIAAFSSIRGVSLADFDGDGKVDMLYTNTSTSYAISLGNGAGTFAAATVYSTPVNVTFTRYTATADFNGDGRNDLLIQIASGSAGAFFIQLNQGSGTFAAAVPYLGLTGGTACQTMGTLDLNNDGFLDVACVSSTAQAETWLGVGDGTFGSAAITTAPGGNSGPNAGSLSYGDLNGDGIIDVSYGKTAGNNVAIRLGLGTGVFSNTETTFGTTTGQGANNADCPYVADFNGDGKLDLIFSPGNSGGAPEIRLNSQTTQILTYSATPVFDCRTYSDIYMTLTGNITSSTAPQGLPGSTCSITLAQDGTGSRLIGTTPTNFVFLGTTLFGTTHTAPVLTTTASKKDTFVLRSIPTDTTSSTSGMSSNWFEVARSMGN